MKNWRRKLNSLVLPSSSTTQWGRASMTPPSPFPQVEDTREKVKEKVVMKAV
jgi:hypothetical protein